MLNKKFFVFFIALLPTLGFSWGLQYRVTNATSGVVKFNSTDWLDWGTRIYAGQTKQNTYYFPPKNMYITLYNYNGSRFTLQTEGGCDLIGLPAYRHPSGITTQVQGHTVRFGSGTVDVVIKDLPGSSHNQKYISCSLIVSE